MKRLLLAFLLLASPAVAQYIDGLPTASAPAASDIIVLCQGGTTGRPGTCTSKQATVAAVQAAAANGTLTVTQPTAQMVFQRDTITGGIFSHGTGVANITVSATLPLTGMQYRVRDNANPAGTPITNWTSAAVPFVTQGANAIPVILPASQKGYLIDFAPVGTTATIVSTTNPIYMGDVVVMAGQSFAQDMLTQGFASDTFNNGLAAYGQSQGTLSAVGFEAAAVPVSCNATVCPPSTTTPTWAIPIQGSSVSYTSAGAAELLRLLANTSGVAIGYTGYAVGGTTMAQWSPSLSPSNETYLKSILVNTAPKFSAFVWLQGQQDGVIATPAATWVAGMKAIVADLQANFKAPSGAPWNGHWLQVVSTIGSTVPTTQGTPAAIEAIRGAGLTYIASVNATAPGTAAEAPYLDLWPIQGGSQVHPTQIGNMPMGRGIYRAVAGMEGLIAGNKLGPTITGATRASGSNVVKVQVAQSGGTGLSGVCQIGTAGQVNATGAQIAAQFTAAINPTVYAVVSPNEPTNQVTITSGAVISATEIDLTLGSTPADNVGLDIWHHMIYDTADGAGTVACGIYDNATDSDGIAYGRHMQMGPTRPVTAGAPANFIAPNAPTVADGTNTSSTVPIVITPSGTGGTAATWTVQYKVTGAGSFTQITGLTSLSVPIRGLVASTSYDVQAAGVNGFGTGAFSSTMTSSTTAVGTLAITAATPSATPVSTPVSLSGTYSNYGTPPTSFDYSTDAGVTWATATGITASGGDWAATGGPVYLATQTGVTVMVRDSDNITVTATSGAFNIINQVNLGITPLIAHYSADQSPYSDVCVTPVTVNGTAISTLCDLSGNGRNLAQTGSARPTLVTGCANGLACMNFASASSQYFFMTAGSTWMQSLPSGPITMLVVLKQATSSIQVAVSVGDETGQDLGISPRGTTGTVFLQRAPAVASPLDGVTNPISQITKAVISYNPVGPTITGNVNSDSQAAAAGNVWSGGHTWNWFSVGAQNQAVGTTNGAFFFNGQIMEVFVWSSAVTPTQISSAISQMTAKWGT